MVMSILQISFIVKQLDIVIGYLFLSYLFICLYPYMSIYYF